MSEQVVVVSPDGRLSFLWDDDLAGLADAGETRVRRASHVDPTPEAPEKDRSDYSIIIGLSCTLLFHVLVGLEAAGVPTDAVFAELRRRFGISGIDEKAGRTK